MRKIDKGLFLDLDGTVIVTRSGKTFPVDKDDWQFNPGILERIESYIEQGYHIAIVTNQGGIEAGHVTMNDFRHKIRRIMGEIITVTGCPFSQISYRFCMSNHPDNFYRMPNPGMGYELALSHILDLSQSIMVGDASGKLRGKINVYRSNDTAGWAYVSGELVPIDKHPLVVEMTKYTGELREYDHADSDLRFAKACGMEYIDIEDFLKPTTDGR